MATVERSVWRIPLVREIAIILLIKLTILFAIRAIWFGAPTVPPDGAAQVSEHLLRTADIDSKPDEESPR